MREAMQIYLDLAAPGVTIAPISTRMLSIMGAVAFNREWRSMATLMGHYARHGEDGSPDEANRLLGEPTTTLQQWSREHPPA